jgi:hypothetical protein
MLPPTSDPDGIRRLKATRNRLRLSTRDVAAVLGDKESGSRDVRPRYRFQLNSMRTSTFQRALIQRRTVASRVVWT